MIVKGVLKEELQNSLELKKLYEKKLANIPKGCLVKKVIKGHEYYYIAKRVGRKVNFVYKGHLDKEQIKEYNDAKIIRQKYRKLLSEVNRQIKFIKGALRERKKTKTVSRSNEKI